MNLLDRLRALQRDELGLPPSDDRDAEPEVFPAMDFFSAADDKHQRDVEIEALVYAQREHNRWIGERAKARIEEEWRLRDEKYQAEQAARYAAEAAFKADLLAVCEKHGLWIVPCGWDNDLRISIDAAAGREVIEDAS